jgi:hypothetical protein
MTEITEEERTEELPREVLNHQEESDGESVTNVTKTPAEVLKSTKLYLKEKLAKLPDLLAKLSTNMTDREAKALRKKIGELNEEIDMLKQSIAVLAPEKPMDNNRRKAISAALREFKPRFAPETNVETFFTGFENYILREYETKEEQNSIMVPFLQACMEQIPNVAQWFKSTVVKAKDEAGDNWDLQKLKTLFYHHWTDSRYKSTKAIRCNSFSMAKSETGPQFVHRVLQLWGNTEVDFQSKSPEWNPMKRALVERMPDDVQRHLSHLRNPETYQNLEEILDEIRGFPGRSKEAKLALKYCDYCPDRVTYQCGCSGYLSFLSGGQKRDVDNLVSNATGKKKQKISNQPGSTDSSKASSRLTKAELTRRKENKLCYGCGQEVSADHKCSKVSTTNEGSKDSGHLGTKGDRKNDKVEQGQNVKFGQVSIDLGFPGSVDLDEAQDFNWEAVEDDVSFKAVQGGGEALPPVAPITINDVRVLAVLDTNADISFIKPSLAKSLDLGSIPTTGRVMMAQNGNWVDRTASTKECQIRCGDKTAKGVLEIFEMHGNYDVALGVDLMPKLGIFLVNIPTNFPEEKEVRFP